MNHSLVIELIKLVKQHRKPSSPKSIGVLMKVIEPQLLTTKYTWAQFRTQLTEALSSPTVWSDSVPQQHSEEELRACFQNLLTAMDEV